MASAVVAALGVVGCGHVDLHEIVLRPSSDPASPSAAAGALVPIFFGTRSPGRPFYDVALLQAVGYGAEADEEHVARAVSSRANELGCDAVVRVHIDRGWSRAHGFGVCVRWSPAKAPETAAPPAAPEPPPSPPPASPSDQSL